MFRANRGFNTGFILIMTLLVFILSVGSAQAYRVEPLVAKIEPSGSGASMRLMIGNTGISTLVLELNALRVTTDEEGEVVREPEENDLIIFPVQTSIPPGREQAVQVRYIGDAELESGRVYAVRISQLPIDAAGTESDGPVGTQVKIGVNFLSHILVETKDMQSNLQISEVARADSGEINFVATNTGNGTALLRELDWKVSDASGNSVTVTPKDVNTGNFGALISGSPKRSITINGEATESLSGEITISPQLN